jgi:CRP-like cAMP-binding protein
MHATPALGEGRKGREDNDMVPVGDLKKLGLFKGLTDDQVGRLAKITTVKKCKRGKVVFRQGAPAKHLFLVKKGTVSLRRIEEHVGVSFVTRVAGELLGAASFMEPQEYTLTGLCVEDTELYAIDANKLFAIFQKDSVLGYKMALAVARIYFGLYQNARGQLLAMLKTPAIITAP